MACCAQGLGVGPGAPGEKRSSEAQKTVAVSDILFQTNPSIKKLNTIISSNKRRNAPQDIPRRVSFIP
jgi:hypothetical protein